MTERRIDITQKEKMFGHDSMGGTIHVPQKSNELRVQLVHDDAVVPVKAHSTDSGYDLYTVEETTIEAYTSGIARTGIAVQLPPGFEMVIRPRSGISTKTSVRVLIGTIDSGYTGEIGIIVDNPTDSRMTIAKGTKLAQGVIQQVYDFQIEVVKELNTTERGSRGYGSTGV